VKLTTQRRYTGSCVAAADRNGGFSLNVNGSDLSGLIPAYVLGALDPEERVAFESWLQHHPEAQAELAVYQSLADSLVLTVPGRPAPDHLQADLRQRLAASRSTVAGSQQIVTAEHAPVTLPERMQHARARAVRYGLAAAAVIALVVLSIVIAWQVTKSGPGKADPAQLFAEIAAQQGAVRYSIVPGEDQNTLTGELIVSPQGNRAVIRVAQLPELRPDQTFQLWLLDVGGTLRSGGLFQGSAPDSPTYIPVPLGKPISAYQRLGVSIEPAGGSPLVNQPSGPVVFRVPLT
jgi:anti-sigma-K factor RskA